MGEFICINEQVPFGSQSVDPRTGKILKHFEAAPFKVMPVCQKYQDFLLKEPALIYIQLFRAMARMAAWDHCGAFNLIFGPKDYYTEEQFIESQQIRQRPAMDEKRAGAART